MARLPEIVADASVVSKWFVPETASDIAVLLRDGHAEGRLRLLAPSLMPYEVANALRYHPAMTSERLREAVRALFDLQVHLVRPSPELLEPAAAFALQEKLTLYDACYAVLADRHSCPLVTEDSRLLRSSTRAVSLSKWSLQR
jgi:predicted nucleic acid-binding protein